MLIDLKNNKNENFKIFITKNNVLSKNPNLNLGRAIKKIKTQEINIHLSKFVMEKVPLVMTEPIGESPKGFQFLHIKPYNLYVTVNGPEEVINQLKTQGGLKLSFNLNEILDTDLEAIESSMQPNIKKDVISYYIPTAWKKVNIPEISSSPIEIDDPEAKKLRMEFLKSTHLPITFPIPVILFFPSTTSEKLNSNTVSIANNDFVKKINNIDLIDTPLYAEGVSELFLDILKDKLFIMIYVTEKNQLDWNIQAALSLEMQKDFTKRVLAEKPLQEHSLISLNASKQFLKMRFRKYMNGCRLWESPTEKLTLKITLKNNKIHIIPEKK